MLKVFHRESVLEGGGAVVVVVGGGVLTSSGVLTTRSVTHADGDNATHMYGCTLGMHGGREKADGGRGGGVGGGWGYLTTVTLCQVSSKDMQQLDLWHIV